MDRLESASAGFAQKSYRFGGFRLRADGTLLRGDVPVLLTTRELAALRLLLAAPGRVLTLQELRQALWTDAPVPADSVSRCIASLRKKLEPEECIEAVYKRGYRLAVAAWPIGLPPGPLPCLAIVPFIAEYGVPEHLGAAVAEESAAGLAGARPAIVSLAARDSVCTLARRGLAPEQIGKMLNADLVLTGRLRALPAHYRLRVEMISVPDGAQVWVEDLFVDRARTGGLESEVVNRVDLRMRAEAGLSIHASGHASGHNSAAGDEAAGQYLSPEQATRRHEAYELLQRARYEWQTMERHRMQDALQHLLRALELSPGYAAAQVELCNLCIMLALYGFMPPAVAADSVRRVAPAAETISGGAEAALPVLGWISFHFDRNLPAALRLFERANRLPYSPLSYNPWIMRAQTLLALSRHRFTEAIELLESTIQIDPWSAWPQARLAWAHHLGGHAAASVQLAHTALQRFPQHEGTQLYGAMILAFNGETGRAVELAQRLAQRLPSFDLATAVHAYTLAMAGQQDAARSILERLEWLSRERYVLKTFSAAAYAALDEPGKALADLRSAEQSRCPWFFLMLADPRLKTLHTQPEFQSMQAILSAMESELQPGEPLR
jgi:tetratricopeptide (TPR) repeat protein/TolB-like protein